MREALGRLSEISGAEGGARFGDFIARRGKCQITRTAGKGKMTVTWKEKTARSESEAAGENAYSNGKFPFCKKLESGNKKETREN